MTHNHILYNILKVHRQACQTNSLSTSTIMLRALLLLLRLFGGLPVDTSDNNNPYSTFDLSSFLPVASAVAIQVVICNAPYILNYVYEAIGIYDRLYRKEKKR